MCCSGESDGGFELTAAAHMRELALDPPAPKDCTPCIAAHAKDGSTTVYTHIEAMRLHLQPYRTQGAELTAVEGEQH